MPFGYYIQELESVAGDFQCEFGHSSLAKILDSLELSKLSKFRTEDRVLFYKTLMEQIRPGDLAVGHEKLERGYVILHETDAMQAVNGFVDLSRTTPKQSNLIRAIDIFCEIFPGGCPWRK
ncbi:hypothetical protein [Microvirga massiliensis]|uniref:hypothetical protein n=1 Tax=Microvirga massiliensis TaxID=1033741 RepID=UPI00062BA815|nr:hypothetical protein [Microvirga massiliensis]